MSDGKHMTIAKGQTYFIERAKELEWMCEHGTPWVFLCASALLDLLASMVTDKCQRSTEKFCHYDREKECLSRDKKEGNKGKKPAEKKREKEGGSCRYENFIIEYMPTKYGDFSYKDTNGTAKTLPQQMWSILRCGIIHSFSLTPGKMSEPNTSECDIQTDELRNIVLCHRKEAKTKGWWHLCAYSIADEDAALFVAEDFVEDLRNVISHVFAKAERDQELKENIENWLRKKPPIAGGA